MGNGKLLDIGVKNDTPESIATAINGMNPKKIDPDNIVEIVQDGVKYFTTKTDQESTLSSTKYRTNVYEYVSGKMKGLVKLDPQAGRLIVEIDQKTSINNELADRLLDGWNEIDDDPDDQDPTYRI